ncbi:MAG TPA: hypothetical protein DCE14_03275 [Kosmotogaceae bacterium]|nr:hypothetical protein [Kosmotogaceae bacterium]
MKLCVIRGCYDLLRVIPFGKPDKCEFKFCFLGNDYEFRMHPLGDHCFLTPGAHFHLNEWEITYHKKKAVEPAKFQIKSISNPPFYHNTPIKNIADPRTSAEFPIPLARLGIVKNDVFREYKKKEKNHEILDIGDSNVVELYLVSSTFNLNSFLRKWEVFELIYTVAPMEYFVNGKFVPGFFTPKLEAIYSNDEPSFFKAKINLNDQVGVLVNWFSDDNIDGVKQRSFFSVYENGEYLKYLACAPINYYYPDGSKSPTREARVHQLGRASGRMDPGEYHHWKDVFEALSGQVKKQKLKLDGFSLEAARMNRRNRLLF